MTHQHFLNYQLQNPNSNKPTLVFIHGLFGDLNNLGIIARVFSEEYPILRIDLRNHGHSFHAVQMNYHLMAQDVINLLTSLQINKTILIGHSMGGKTAMKVAAMRPELVEKLVVIDIAPVPYPHHSHSDVFNALFAVKQAQPQTRQQAKPIMAKYIAHESILQFILKSFDPKSADYCRYNLTALFEHYAALMDWQPCYYDKPTLFIKGSESDYILPDYKDIILAQFPAATSFTINGSGHWVHADKPEAVSRAISRFLS